MKKMLQPREKKNFKALGHEFDHKKFHAIRVDAIILNSIFPMKRATNLPTPRLEKQAMFVADIKSALRVLDMVSHLLDFPTLIR